MNIQENVNLQPYNTFGLSATAERLVVIESADDVPAWFESGDQPALILGGGSNLLLCNDVSGTVMKMEVDGIRVLKDHESCVRVEVGAGVIWHEWVLYAIEKGWAGIENLSLIPGMVGAAPMQNIGAYGVEVKSVIESVTAWLSHDKCWQTFSNQDCEFGYRESIFKHALKNKAIITSVIFRLSKVPTFNTSYGAIEAQLEAMGVRELTLRSVSNAVIAIRQQKLPDPAKIGNSGSFFKNPVIDRIHFERLQKDHPGIVGYPAGESKVKVAAGWLIEHAGYKGKRLGNYGVHDRQALVLVNYGGAAGSDIFALSQEIIAAVKSRYDITLEREVNVI